MSDSAAQVDVVCHQIRSPDNLGAIARLMANFGFERLILSEPVTYAFENARKMAVGADSVLDSLKVCPTLGEAVGDAVYALGTTSRTQLRRRQALSPEEGIEKLLLASQKGRVALVLGGEQRGLSDEDLAFCQDIVVIPTRELQPSMNLAQSAAVLLYLASRTPNQAAPPPVEPPATLRTLQALESRWQALLLEAGLLNPQGPEHIMGELSRSLLRAELTQREAELWLSAAQHLLRGLTPRKAPDRA
jgi:tRNA/rRNA methyltransferase